MTPKMIEKAPPEQKMLGVVHQIKDYLNVIVLDNHMK